ATSWARQIDATWKSRSCGQRLYHAGVVAARSNERGVGGRPTLRGTAMRELRTIQWLVVFAALWLCACLGAATAAEPIAIEAVKLDRPVDFQIDVLPLLRKSCLACHHAPKPKGDLLLETV